MTNLELEQYFQTVEDSCLTIFDIYEELATREKDYRTWSIAKTIKTIYEAYELYHNHKDTTTRIITAVSNMDFSKIVESFDLSKLLTNIPTEYQKILADVVASAK